MNDRLNIRWNTPAGAEYRNGGTSEMQSAKPSVEEKELWKKICGDLQVEDCVPLFATEADELTVKTKMIGDPPQRPVLQRSDKMELKVIDIAKQLVADFKSHKDNPEVERRFDGMLYMMGWEQEDGGFLPLYVGKTETLGTKGDGRLSTNLKGVENGKNKRNFARWGDNHAYHVGDLSAWALPGHKEGKQQRKYKRWADTLFRPESIPSLRPRLKQRTYFWATAWEPTKTSLWDELGPTTLAVSEYLVIGVAGKVSPEYFLNRDGIPRQFLE